MFRREFSIRVPSSLLLQHDKFHVFFNFSGYLVGKVSIPSQAKLFKLFAINILNIWTFGKTQYRENHIRNDDFCQNREQRVYYSNIFYICTITSYYLKLLLSIVHGKVGFTIKINFIFKILLEINKIFIRLFTKQPISLIPYIIFNCFSAFDVTILIYKLLLLTQ